MESLKIDVVVPAAGVGKRMQLNIPKQYALLGSKTVLEHTIDALFKCSYVNNIIIGVSQNDEYFDDLQISKNNRVIKAIGGKERSDTVRLALDKVTTQWVMVHDAARPLVKLGDLNNLAKLSKTSSVGGILACKASDTLKKVVNGKIVATVPREDIYRAYTPQMFKTNLLKQALEHANNHNLAITDDASAIELLGYSVDIIEGSADNFKLTTPEDLMLAKLLLNNKE